MGRTREMGRHGEDGLGEDAYVGGPAENNTEVRETILECGRRGRDEGKGYAVGCEPWAMGRGRA